jgi:hypothetical protein
MRDHRVNFDLAGHIHIDNLWHIGPALGPAKGRAAPKKGYNTISIENLHLQSGIYFLQILQGENSTVKKLMKK